jgi:plasmid stabilization system protein ParE
MPYLIRLTDRALRDLEAIYDFIEADSCKTAFAWFNALTAAIYSLERFPERGAVIPEDKTVRHLLFGKKPMHTGSYTRWTNTKTRSTSSIFVTAPGPRS